MPPDPRVHVGVAAVVLHKEQLLLIQRGGSGPFASDGRGTWSVPGGWLDYGETPEAAAEREVLEETGVTAHAYMEDGWVNCYSEAQVGAFQIVTLFMVCTYVSGEPTVTEPGKCPAVEWVPRKAVRDRSLFAPLDAWWPR